MRATNFMLRSRSQDPTTLAESVRKTVWRLDPDLPIANVMSLETFMANQYVGMRVFGAMIAGFGVVALLLASVGVYGVLAYSVAQRTQEIGVRVALGASRNDVLTMVLRDGLKLAFFGLVIGLPGVLVVRRLIEGALEGLAGGVRLE
jgi:putative ABC transport system permease protein